MKKNRGTAGQDFLLTFMEKRRGWPGILISSSRSELMPDPRKNFRSPSIYALEMRVILPYCCCRGNEIISMEKNNKC